jgi:rfaE bifunctional protein nucleotidyltransferase chain/domain/rfaE bifunctional protein kinase chain/domain
MNGHQTVVVVGDSLLDRDVHGDVTRICPDAPAPVVEERESRARPGGAALAATLARRSCSRVALITAIGDDPAGGELLALLERAGVETVNCGLRGQTPEKIRIRCGDASIARIDRGGTPPEIGRPDRSVAALLRRAGAVLVSDYGRGIAAEPTLRSMISNSDRPIVWDPHPRGPAPIRDTTVVTPNASELTSAFPPDGSGGHTQSLAGLADSARRARHAWKAQGVAVTRGSAGAMLLSRDGPPLVIPAEPVTGRDTCGAGDAFAAAVASSLAGGALPSEAVVEGVKVASLFVSDGAASALQVGPDDRVEASVDLLQRDAVGLARTSRAHGRTVVATGGCFDLLHAGHLALLQSARALGDCLIVCLNSDRSVRRLKGPGRPVMTENDRARLLEALEFVDAVAVFDEDTPEAVLDRIRPDVFAKGGDYSGADLPETATLRKWGGEVVVLPYMTGRSTSAIIERVLANTG